MTAPRDRQLDLARALQEFEELLVGWQRDEEPVDLADLAVYTKESER